MAYIKTLQYFCPNCGHSWEEDFQFDPIAGTGCRCPNCEESVTPSLKN